MSSAILAVPIHGAEDEVLELPKDQLPDDPNEIMQILANELAPLKLWLELAVSLLHGFFAASVVQHRLRAAAGGASATGGGGRGSSNMRAYNYIFQRIVIALRHRFFDGDDSAVAGLAGLMRRAPAFPEIAVEMLFSFCTAEVLIEPVRNENAYHLLTTTNYMILSVSHDFCKIQE